MTKTDRALPQAVIAAAQAAGDHLAQENIGKQDEIGANEGLVSYLKAQALATPGSFLTLLGKVGLQSEDDAMAPITRIELVAPNLDKVSACENQRFLHEEDEREIK